MYSITTETKWLNNSELNYIEYEIHNIISVIKELITKDEITLKEISTNLKNKIKNDKTISDLKEEPELQSSYYDAMYEDEILITREIHRQQRYSKLLIIFTFYEDSLRKISDIIRIKLNRKMGKKNKLNDLEFYFNFILSTATIDDEDLQKSFNFINSQKFFRDKIAHKNGVYQMTDKKRKYGYVKQEGIAETLLGSEQYMTKYI
jgi:hypothetical protein